MSGLLQWEKGGMAADGDADVGKTLPYEVTVSDKPFERCQDVSQPSNTGVTSSFPSVCADKTRYFTPVHE